MNERICRWSSTEGDHCSRQVLGNRWECVFHIADKDDHEVKEFENQFSDELVRQLATHHDFLDMTGFNFPRPFFVAKMLPLEERPEGNTLPLKVSFKEAVFHSTFNGEKIIFEKEVEFQGAEFRDVAAFNESTFRGQASFSSVSFKGGASFFQVTFEWDALFGMSVIEPYANFIGSEFLRAAYFLDVEVVGIANFSGVTLHGELALFGAKFRDVTYFDKALLHNAVFSEATFEGEAYFFDSRFEGYADFSRTRFSKDLRIRPVGANQWGGVIWLAECTFEGTTEIDCSGLLGDPIAPLVFLRECRFHRTASMILRGAMGSVSLLRTDLSKVDFIDEEWRPKVEILLESRASAKNSRVERILSLPIIRQTFGRSLIPARSKVLEELVLQELARGGGKIPGWFNDVTSDRVAQLYRGLRDNFEKRKRYAQAGDFFIGEMEVLRQYYTVHGAGTYGEYTSRQGITKRPLWDAYRFFLFEPYKQLAWYGESILRPVLWSLGVIAGFTLLRIYGSPGLPSAFGESLLAYFQLLSNATIDQVERLIAVPLLGLLFIALRRRMERR